MSPETVSDGQLATAERYRPGFGTNARPPAGPAPAEAGRVNGAPYEPAPEKPRLPSLDLEVPAAPDFTAKHWLETSAGTLADHPLLRGLLMELPPKGSTPPPGWLDRWFEATRAILELLYVQQPS